MSQDWDRPITKPLPGPVPSEGRQMSPDELDRVVEAGARAAHYAAGHDGSIVECALGCLAPPMRPVRPVVE